MLDLEGTAFNWPFEYLTLHDYISYLEINFDMHIYIYLNLRM